MSAVERVDHRHQAGALAKPENRSAPQLLGATGAPTPQGRSIKIARTIGSQPRNWVRTVASALECMQDCSGTLRRQFENGAAAFVTSAARSSANRGCPVQVSQIIGYQARNGLCAVACTSKRMQDRLGTVRGEFEDCSKAEAVSAARPRGAKQIATRVHDQLGLRQRAISLATEDMENGFSSVRCDLEHSTAVLAAASAAPFDGGAVKIAIGI